MTSLLLVATIADEVIALDMSSALVDGQVVTTEGLPTTMSGAVIPLGPSGVVVVRSRAITLATSPATRTLDAEEGVPVPKLELETKRKYIYLTSHPTCQSKPQIEPQSVSS